MHTMCGIFQLEPRRDFVNKVRHMNTCPQVVRTFPTFVTILQVHSIFSIIL